MKLDASSRPVQDPNLVRERLPYAGWRSWFEKQINPGGTSPGIESIAFRGVCYRKDIIIKPTQRAGHQEGWKRIFIEEDAQPLSKSFLLSPTSSDLTSSYL